MEKLYKNVLFVASVNGVLLQKYWRNTEFNFFLSRIVYKRDIRIYRTNINGPIQSLDYAESNSFNFQLSLLRPL